ncbi:hypothetical protein D3C85_1509820 [compost metagenome]
MNKHDAERLPLARWKRQRRAERNMRTEYLQGRGPEGLDLMKDGRWMVECCSCERSFEWPAMASEYEEGFHYCGGSERCCP